MKFSKEFMKGVLYGDTEGLISDEITDTGRWSVHHSIIFKHDDKFYRAHYSVGATEQQDERPWEYDKEVECTEVRPVEKTVIVYEAVT